MKNSVANSVAKISYKSGQTYAKAAFSYTRKPLIEHLKAFLNKYEKKVRIPLPLHNETLTI